MLSVATTIRLNNRDLTKLGQGPLHGRSQDFLSEGAVEGRGVGMGASQRHLERHRYASMEFRWGRIHGERVSASL